MFPETRWEAQQGRAQELGTLFGSVTILREFKQKNKTLFTYDRICIQRLKTPGQRSRMLDQTPKSFTVRISILFGYIHFQKTLQLHKPLGKINFSS